jgi:hypothetical protein
VNDEVSVAELLEREGWNEAPADAKSRFRVVAVMLAVVLGCGLAALLVHIGSSDPQADAPGPAVFNLPRPPTGGLAGGGVPSSQPPEVTDTSSTVVVTNEAEAGEGDSRIPWLPRHKATTKTRTVTVTEGNTPAPAPTTNPGAGAPTGGSSNNPGQPGNNTTTPPSPKPICTIIIIQLC